jgi:C1A family cysteine protease
VRKIARYGWRPDIPDWRDHRLALVRSGAAATPDAADLRPLSPPVVDQGQAGSCTGNAIAYALLFAGMREDNAPVELSRLFIYYNERAIEGTVDQDAGAMIRDGIKSVAQYGACLELAWPYNLSNLTVKPDDVAYYDAAQRRAIQYLRVAQMAEDLEACLAAGFPVVFGFSVYESFESDELARTGVVPMPQPGERQVGGHAVALVGYDKTRLMFLVRNSWGTGWGQGGYCWMPYDYVLNSDLADDFWTIRQVAKVAS